MGKIRYGSRIVRLGMVLAASLLLGDGLAGSARERASAQAAPEQAPQTILAPGLYLFQTRTRDGTCNDAPRTGYVTSAIGALDGVPGSRVMTLQLLNSKYWPTWTLTVTDKDLIIGSAVMGGGNNAGAGASRFELSAKKEDVIFF